MLFGSVWSIVVGFVECVLLIFDVMVIYDVVGSYSYC